jgi:hypothetical protein
LRTTFAVETGNFNRQLHGKSYYHEIASPGEFNGFYFEVSGTPRLSSRCAPIGRITTLRRLGKSSLSHNTGRALDGRNKADSLPRQQPMLRGARYPLSRDIVGPVTVAAL